MFDKILIANRGEIACRVMETATLLGVKTVAVYSDADATSKHVALADEAVHIGGSAPADSYLRGEVIIAAALKTGAKAIHPGYGFLSENPDFVDQIEAAGLTFIGPSANAIRAMGLKDAAKVLMQNANVPVVPGYHGENQDDNHLALEAGKIGYPVLIKAVAGGGGKGMRLVEAADGFLDRLASARAEAQTAFGNDDVLVEKYITKPRHIEVQVFGDGEKAVHLFERDCSLQRRHQKVIEEAPAPSMTVEMREAMGAAAVKAAEAINYKGAGTIEFIVDGSDGLRSDGFWFMEMNTRLQVEHPVTEAITGVDLVEWQLRVAAGEALPATQEDLSINGHSFEARLYAEDVPAGFLPATGTLEHLSFPDWARSDSGVRQGDAISPFYDPMISKVIVHGTTRSIALKKLEAALDQTEVGGTVTNLTFLSALACHEGFAKGDVDTDLIARDLNVLTEAVEVTAETKALAALKVSGLMDRSFGCSGFSLWEPLLHDIHLLFENQAIVVGLKSYGTSRHLLTVDGIEVEAKFAQGYWTLNGAKAASTVLHEDHVTVFQAGGATFKIVDALDRATSSSGNGNLIEAPMPGAVRAVLAVAGDTVVEGQKLVVLEAMKMEHALLAARDGVVEELLVAEGDQVEAGAALIVLAEAKA
ncbi:MAG: acetyl/propionyl/methylcrotonyl-CoA carboxylase subunit alpha [Paracoccaceae bacterium]|nr:acetyl/propionyl/methylcrotonyl-CoA carboxylase subunit alpha [Paracoccaceae bacterium]MDG2260327.1 acetyl/propionyl/methylcrotonyl-CoA carboxylase subunit alpha [Paracoccaceae bacterium]